MVARPLDFLSSFLLGAPPLEMRQECWESFPNEAGKGTVNSSGGGGNRAHRPIPPQFPTAKVDGRTAGETSHGGFKRTLWVALLGGLRAPRACEGLPLEPWQGWKGNAKIGRRAKQKLLLPWFGGKSVKPEKPALHNLDVHLSDLSFRVSTADPHPPSHIWVPGVSTATSTPRGLALWSGRRH